MQRHLGIVSPPLFISAHLAKSAIPQFHVGYEKQLACFETEVRKKFPSLILVGNYLRGASVEACVSLSKNKLSLF
jgi:protoporphyrinogen oxidase